MDSGACNCIWLPEWRQMTIAVMPDTGTEATIRLRWVRALWLITSSWQFLFTESVCLYNLSPRAEPQFIGNYEDTPLFKLVTPILGMAGETTNQTCTSSNLD